MGKQFRKCFSHPRPFFQTEIFEHADTHGRRGGGGAIRWAVTILGRPRNQKNRASSLLRERERERAKWLCVLPVLLCWKTELAEKEKVSSDEIVFGFPWHDLHRWTRVCVGPLAAQQVDSWKLEAIRGWSFDCGGLCVCCACFSLLVCLYFFVGRQQLLVSPEFVNAVSSIF